MFTRGASISAEELFRDACNVMGWDYQDLSERQWRDLRDALNTSLKSVWEERAVLWPWLMREEEFALAEGWFSGRTELVGPYEAGDVVYDYDSGRYYMALDRVIAEPPAEWNATSQQWQERGGLWKELKTSYPEAVEYQPDLEINDSKYTNQSVFRFAGKYWLPKVEALGRGLTGMSPKAYPDRWMELPLQPCILPRWMFQHAPIGAIEWIAVAETEQKLDWREVETGYELFDYPGGVLRVRYRLAAPRLVGDYYDANRIYEPAPPMQQIYRVEYSVKVMAPEETQQVVQPVIYPAGGLFLWTQEVVIATTTDGATIRYTLDGTVPDENHGFVYSGPFTVNQSVVIQARAFKNGWKMSEVAESKLDRAYEIYHGSSENPLLDGAGIVMLLSSINNTVEGSYEFPAVAEPGQYLYLAWPNEIAAQPRAGDGFVVGGMPATDDLAGVDEGYGESSNGWPYRLVSVNGREYRVYRSKYRQTAMVTVEVKV